ncbi:hypothetical protein LMG26411_02724 [Cupriavidus numazuensis]|uniref:Acyl-CoA dehydrogenase n=1 Tax=Cupriavidus numazuensis TaxID=221992 RepID=A0ABM8TGR4_9BURK|nr:hypothetical protein LMG26411_02724 [Cupriavidus numazuensis]
MAGTFPDAGVEAADPAERRRKAVQLHGGMGMTDELEVGDYFKALTQVDVLLGDTDLYLERYGDAMAA